MNDRYEFTRPWNTHVNSPPPSDNLGNVETKHKTQGYDYSIF